jgi:hypothetical protein
VQVIVAACIRRDHACPSKYDGASIGQLASFAPTVLHTARARARQVPTAALGVDGAVAKPIDFEVLAPAVEPAAEWRI